MASHNGNPFQPPQEGSALTIVMPRGYNQPNSFMNQGGVQDVLRRITIVNHTGAGQQQTSDNMVTSTSCNETAPAKEHSIMDSLVGSSLSTSDNITGNQKLQVSQFATGHVEAQYPFGQFVSQSGDIQMAQSETISLQSEQRDDAVEPINASGIVANDQGGLDIVNTLLSSCGQIATLNTQQGQVFNVVILGDPQNNTLPSLSTNVLQPGNGVPSMQSAGNASTSVPAVPPGTLLLAVAPTPISNNVPNIVNAPKCTTEEGPNSMSTLAAPTPSSTAEVGICRSVDTGSRVAKVGGDKAKVAKDKTEEHKREKKFACDMCDKSYFTSSHLKAHKRSHTGERPYICDICGNCYHRPETLAAHRRIHLGIKRFECDICGKKYGYYSHLNVHIKRVHKKLRPYACETCGKAFTMKNNLRYHQKIHLIEKPHKCLECGRGFTYPTDLNRHMRGHTGEKKFTCNICNKAFSESGTMTRHKRKVHSGLSEPGEVTEKSHEPTQSEQEAPLTYECTECDKSFLQEQHLNFHKRTHHETKDKTVKCSYCPRLFETLRCARAHENRMHLLDRTPREKYRCDICEEVCLTKKKLAEHKSTHYKLDDDSDYTNISTCQQENGYYKCNICDREFAFPAGLIVHRFSHSNVRPYTCSECGQSFKLRRYLTSHYERCKKNQVGTKEKQGDPKASKSCDAMTSLDGIIGTDQQLIGSVSTSQPFAPQDSEYKPDAYSDLGGAQGCKDGKSLAVSKSMDTNQESMNVDSLLEGTLQNSVASIGDVVTSTGLVHVIILANKDCDDIHGMLPNESTLTNSIISSGALSSIAPAQFTSTVSNIVDISNVSNVNTMVSDRETIAMKSFDATEPMTSQDKLACYGSQASSGQITLADMARRSPVGEHNVSVESSSEGVDCTVQIKPPFNGTCRRSGAQSHSEQGSNACEGADDDVDSTVTSPTSDEISPPSQPNDDNMVVYLSF